MLIRRRLVSAAGCLALWAAAGLPGQFLFGQHAPAWNLPQGVVVKDNGPRTYRFTVDYDTANSKGEIIRRQRLTGDYTRGLDGGEVIWKNVAQANVNGATAPFGPAQKRDFMDGFQYKNDLPSTLKPDFFKGFPPTAVFERNLVWDTGMMEMFGQNYFGQLKLNEPFSLGTNEDVNMPGVGTFRNHNVVLEWVGRSERNGQDCALIRYQAGILQPAQHRKRRYDVDWAQRLLGSHLGVAGDQADRIRTAIGECAGRAEAHGPGRDTKDQCVPYGHL